MQIDKLTEKVIGCAYRVHGELGSGFVEKVYENALRIELGETGLAVGTVRKAIAVLVDEGLAYTVPGRGTFASPRKH